MDIDAEVEAGIALEQKLDWEGSLRHFEGLASRLSEVPEAERPRARATVEMRRANALMELRRMDAARAALDAAMDAARVAGDPILRGQALLAAGVYAANTGDPGRAEAFLLRSLDVFTRRDDTEHRQGAGWAFLNLGGLYGKTGRLDVALVTLTKAMNTLGEIENWVGVAAAWETQARLRQAMGDDERAREDLAEAVVFYDREGMREKADALRAMLKGKIV